jgi:hypothetical protein
MRVPTPENFMLLSRPLLVLTSGLLLSAFAFQSGDINQKHPLGPTLKVLADDVKSQSYRKLVLEKMIPTDLAAEWQRVETEDNPHSYLTRRGFSDGVGARERVSHGPPYRCWQLPRAK